MVICEPDELWKCGPPLGHYLLANRVDSNKKYEFIYSNMRSEIANGGRQRKPTWFCSTVVGWHTFYVFTETFYINGHNQSLRRNVLKSLKNCQNIILFLSPPSGHAFHFSVVLPPSSPAPKHRAAPLHTGLCLCTEMCKNDRGIEGQSTCTPSCVQGCKVNI